MPLPSATGKATSCVLACALCHSLLPPQSFSDAMATLVRDPGLGRRMGAAARRHVIANFSRSAFALHLEQLCVQLMVAPAPRAVGPLGLCSIVAGVYLALFGASLLVARLVFGWPAIAAVLSWLWPL